MRCSRRAVLGTLATLGAVAAPDVAGATLARGLTLAELVQKSAYGALGTALDSRCEWATFGKTRVIVTDTRVRIEEAVLPREPPRELVVRVLGGHVGDVGERVDGQAKLVLGEPCLLFLIGPVEDRTFVTGAAQGHFLLTWDGRDRRLAVSPHLPRLLRPVGSASERLGGKTLGEALELVRAASR